MTVKPRGVGILISLLTLLALGGCRRERQTEVTIQGEASPTFTFKGSGKLASFSVYLVPPSPEEMTKPFSEQAPMWRISALPDYLHGVSSVPTLCEQNQLVIGNRLNFVGHRLCK